MRMQNGDYGLVNEAPIWRRIVTAVMALCAVLVTAVTARAECISVDAWRDGTVKGSPAFDVGPSEQVGPALQTLITEAYNRTPPKSNADPDAVYMLMSRIKVNGMPFGDVMFGLFKGGCLLATFVAPLPHASPEQRGEAI